MKLENIVCTLEQSRKLVDLGINLHSLFGWVNNGRNKSKTRLVMNPFDRIWDGFAYPAFTQAELEIMMVCDDKASTTVYDTDRHVFTYKGTYISEHPTGVQCSAAMVILMLENGLATASKMNAKLKTA